MEPKIIFAKDKFTSKIIHIDKAVNGKKCNCICIECGIEMQAIQGKDRKWHYRHTIDTNCQGGFETAVHFMAKQILEENLFIILNDGSKFTYERTIVEEYVSKNFKPDIQLLNDIETLLIEIKVAHGITYEKLLKIKEYNKKVIEIDLSCISRTISYEELKEIVLNDPSNKILIHEPTELIVPIKNQIEPVHQILKIAFWVFVGLLIWNFLFPKKRYSND